MATRYAVETVFKLIDEFTAPLGKLTAEGKAAGGFLKNDLMKAEQTLDAVPGKLLNIGRTALQVGVGGVAAGMGVATKQYVDFDNAITAAGAKFKDLDVTSGDYQSHLESLGATARDVAKVTQFNAVDTAGALDKMAMAGLSSSQAMALLAGTADLATSTGLDLTSAVDMATDAMGAFNLTKDEFGQPLDEAGLAASLGRISDVVAKTTNMANTDMNMWFEAVTKGAPTFTSLGGTVEDFSAMVGILANSGIKGAEAGTALRNMMLGLSAPSKAGAAALDALGVSAFDASGNMLPILDIMKQFEGAFGDTSSLKAYKAALAEAGGDMDKVNISDFVPADMGTKVQSLEAIFGKRTIGSMLVLLSEGSEGISSFSKTLQESSGAAADMAGAMRQSVQAQIQILLSGLTELGFKFVEAFETRGVNIIQKFTEAVAAFDPSALINGLLTAADVAGSLISTMWNLRGVIMAIVVAVTAYKTVMLATAFTMKTVQVAQAAGAVATGIATGIQTAHNAALWGTTVAIEGNTVAAAAGRVGMLMYAAGSKIAAAAQWVLNASLFGCPIVWIIGGIIALVAVIAAVVLAIRNWGAITQWLSGVWAAFTEWLGGVIEAIKGWFASLWEGISGFFVNIRNGISALITDVTGAVGEFLSGTWEGISLWFASVWEGISSFFGSVFEGIGSFFGSVWESVSGFFGGIIEALPGFFSTILDGILTFLFGQNAPAVRQFLEETVASIAAFFTEVFAKAGEFLSGLWTAVSAWIATAGEGIASFFGSVWSGLVSLVTDIGAKVGEFLAGVWTAVSAWFASVWEGISGFFASVWEGVSSFFAMLWNGLVELGTNVAAKVGEVLAGVWQGITAWFASAWEGLGAFFATVKEGIGSFFGSIWEGVQDIIQRVQAAVQPVLEFILGVFNGITSAWQGLVSAFQAGGLVGALQQIGGAILSFLLAPIEKILGSLTWMPGIGGKIEEWQASIAQFREGFAGGGAAASSAAAPMTARDAQSIQTERYAYESTSNSNVTIGLERGLTAQVSGAAPNVRVNQFHTGGF